MIMKQFNKQILKAVNKGIKLALDDYQDIEPIGSISGDNDVIDVEDIIQQRIELNDYVIDLRLPSGTLWCKYNLGCDFKKLNSNSNNPKDWIGKYYAWGEFLANKPEFKWQYYKYCRGEYDEIIKYNENPTYSHNGYCDNLTQLLPEDDAAYQNMHLYNFKFHMPTKEQFNELLYYTAHGEVKDYNGIKGLNGYKFVNNIKGNMVTLFIPYAGYCNNDEIINSDEQGWYWSSTLYQKNNISYAANCLYFDSHYNCDVGSSRRADGLTIRPVINLKK